MPRRRRRPTGVQELLPLEGIAGDAVRLRGGEFRAVLEASPVHFALKPEAEQEAILAGYRRFLNGLSYPLKLLVRVVPGDVEDYLEGLRGPGRRSPLLRRLALDHEAFVRGMTRRARKRWLGLTTVTQDVEDFLSSPEGHAVLANGSSQLLMRQDASAAGLVAETFGLSPQERDFVRSCRRGEGLLIASGHRVALRVEASRLEHELATTDPRELAVASAEGGEVPT